MNKSDQLILVVKREKLFGESFFEGFRPSGEGDYHERILHYAEYMRRGDAETSPQFLQPISYALIYNPQKKQVFAYQRAQSNIHRGEERLQGKWSCGVGGHIEQVDGSDDPLHDSMQREVQEEIEADFVGKPKILGYINDETDEVSQVHFGVLYLLLTHTQIITAKDEEIAQCEYFSLEQLTQAIESQAIEMEGWSQIALQALAQYLEDQPTI